MGFFSEAKARVSRVFSSVASNLADPNFSTGIQFYTPGQPIWSDKDYRTFVKSGYKKNPTVYTCINKITGAAAGINWKLYTDRTCTKTIDEHPLLDLWRRPNPSIPGTGSFIEQCFGFWHMAGNNYIYAYRPTPTSPPLALWVMRPDRMKAVAGPQGVEGYVYGYQSNNPQTYTADQILHMKFPGYDDDIYGLSPIEVASYMADQQNETLGWNTALMQNAGRPASAFFAKSILTPEQRNQIEQEIRKKYSGKRNAGRPLVLEADMTWQNMSLTPMELDFLKSYELGTRGIAAIFDIAPELVGDSAGKTFANVAEARQGLYLENVLPKLDRKSDYLNSWFVPMYPDLADSGAYFTYDKEDIEALQALYAQQKKSIHDMARSDWMAGGLLLSEYCKAIGANKPKFGNVRRFGAVLVTEDSLEDYADQSLMEPAAPPVPVAEGTLPPALPSGTPPNQLALPSATNPTNPTTSTKPPKTPKGAKPATNTVPQAPRAATASTAKMDYSIEEVKTLDANGIYQPDDVNQRLAAYYADGVTHLRWICGKTPCDVCVVNDGQMVETGLPFNSGHILPQAHPNCDCTVIAFSVPEFGKVAMDSLARKIAEYLAERERKHHEENKTTIDSVVVGSNRDNMQLRNMQSETQEASTSTGSPYNRAENGNTPRSNERQLIVAVDSETSLATSGDIYRAFIQRYSGDK